MRVVGAAWIVGGVAMAVAVVPYLWRSNVPEPFSAVGVVAGLFLLVAFAATAGLAAQLRSWLAPVGAVLLVLGWATLIFLIGFVLAPIGFMLFAAGLVRARLVTGDVLGIALGLFAGAVAAVAFVSLQSV